LKKDKNFSKLKPIKFQISNSSIEDLKSNFKAVKNSSNQQKFHNSNLVLPIIERKFNPMHHLNLINLNQKVHLKIQPQRLILNLQRSIKIGLLSIKQEWLKNN
jgi:hypothetical protein